MRNHFVAGLAFAGALCAIATPAAAVPEQLGLTARVSDGGAPISGNHSFAIRIFDAASGGTQVWTETDSVAAQSGLVYLTLGDQTALDANVLDGGPLWVELQVDATVLSPRLAVTSAAYAVRAGVAEDAERLGGQLPTAFLPRGATLACNGTEKMTGISGSGSVTCAADNDTNTTYSAGNGLALSGTQFNASFGGTGAANLVARSDHNHTGTYLPIAALNRTCTGTLNRVTGINTDGTVTCAADIDNDTNTTYSAGTALTLTGTTFSANLSASSAINGTSTAIARADHHHDAVCPSLYTGLDIPSQNATMCTRLAAVPGVNWYNASRSCGVSGAHLCTFQDVLMLRAINGQTQIPASTWLGDRTGDDHAIQVNVAIAAATTDNFDLEVDTNSGTANNFLCCLLRDWP